ncbi:hypothetical protein [Filomicrobium sp.]|uniref:hypothetical protein n=1 Tax=Filomicrobium sp. TaxID=2024831 RepID=UPI002585538C|nr:hypothetical protein [Filomicrobium sp.]MCV0371706.1 hypothetical protein [Filomicrobium sp.]
MALPSFLGTKGPASIRFNNAGAMYPGPSARKFGSIRTEIIGGGHKIAVFPNAIAGAAALFDLMLNGKSPAGKYRYRNKTIRDAIAVWSGGNYVQSYLNMIERYSSFPPDTVLSVEFLQDPARAIPFARAMAHHEAGKAYPLNAKDWERAHVLAFPDAYGTGEAIVAEDEPPPLPTPAKDVLRKSSRKWKLLNWLRSLFGIGAGGTATFSVVDSLNTAQSVMGPVKSFALVWGVPLTIIVCVGGFVVVQVIKAMTEEDYDDGRYQPTGESHVDTEALALD